jgi:hypothetical protein
MIAGAVFPLLLFGCGRGNGLDCADKAVVEKVYTNIKNNYPNKLSALVLKAGGVKVFGRVMDENKFDPNSYDDKVKANKIANDEIRRAYEGGDLSLHDIEDISKSDDTKYVACSANARLATYFGVFVKDITYKITQVSSSDHEVVVDGLK